ncbi:MAG: TIGR00730 family Rossman fold protein [Pseudomonadota bacterium]
MTSATRSLCVYCGARPGTDPAYAAAADAMGAELGKRGWRLVYGAGDVGIMGLLANAAKEAGADTFGVIPEHLVHMEVGKTDLDRYIVTETMHERKKVMFMNADAIAILPGGAGSLDEFFEVLTWAQIGLHGKPIVLVNIAGYWDPLVALIDHVITQGFAASSLKDLFRVADTVEACFDTLNEMLSETA